MSGFPRRAFLTGAMSVLVATPLRPAEAALPQVGARSLALQNIHTGERLAVDYWVDGAYQAEALAAVNYVLRDFRTGDLHVIEPQLLDLLARMRARLETAAPFQVISGYRSPATNAMLRSEREHSGVASKSLHMQGMAIDVRLGTEHWKRCIAWLWRSRRAEWAIIPSPISCMWTWVPSGAGDLGKAGRSIPPPRRVLVAGFRFQMQSYSPRGRYLRAPASCQRRKKGIDTPETFWFSYEGFTVSAPPGGTACLSRPGIMLR